MITAAIIGSDGKIYLGVGNLMNATGICYALNINGLCNGNILRDYRTYDWNDLYIRFHSILHLYTINDVLDYFF
ncbi:MAG: hypothetical protein ABSE83_11725 [Methanobacterium sp.]